MTPSPDTQLIINIAQQAAIIVLSHFKQQLEISKKDNDEFNFLTQADQESNQFILSELKAAFPDDKFLLEETDDRPVTYDGRVWMADPLDGTKEFVNGGEHFSVMIGLCVDGKSVLGCVVRPVTGEVYWAEKDKGAYKVVGNTHQRLHVNCVDKLSEARSINSIAYGEVRPAEKLLAAMHVKSRIPGSSFGLRASDIAEGKAEFFVGTNMRACKWDSCAPQIILEEAGGKVTDIFGKPLDYLQPDHHWRSSFVGSNGKLHDQIIKSIAGIDSLLS